MDKKNSQLYEITYSPLSNLQELKELWLSVKNTNHNGNYFLSWTWIKTWVQTYRPKINVLSAKINGKVVAIALLTKSTEKRRKIIVSQQLRFHQTGNENEDQIWIEYNGFLEDRAHYPRASLACMEYLNQTVKNWDEIVISMIQDKNINDIVPENCNKKHRLRSSSYLIDLQFVKKNYKNYLASISSNTRYQINRSIKLYKKDYGEINIKFANSIEQAIDFFNEAAPLHISRWETSGFNNPLFIGFHHKLMMCGYPKGEVDLIRISAGEDLLGIVYNFVYEGKVHFYLQALNYENNPKLKPGLVIHSMLIQHYLDNNKKIYDFMGGSSQYKKSLASQTDSMSILVIQKQKPIFKLENLAIQIKSTLGNE